MPIDASIEFPQADVDRIMYGIRRSSDVLGKSFKQSVAWAARLVAQSLGKSTKLAPKLRPIVRNPDERYKTDARRAPFGVFRWKPSGEKYFKPIYRSGEYGRIRFFDKKSMSWYTNVRGFKGNRKGDWERIPSGPDAANPELVAPGIKTDKRRIIGRSGLAKKTWAWAAANMSKGGIASIMRAPNIATITWFGGSEGDAGVRIENNLRYAVDALKSGDGDVSSAMERAANKMLHEIDRRAAKTLGMSSA